MGGYNEFSRKKNIFSEKKKNKNKNFEKNWKKSIKNESLGANDMTWTCPGHGRTHKDPYGFKKIQNWTKTNQDTDISKNRKKSKKIRKKSGKNQEKIKKNASKMSHW